MPFNEKEYHTSLRIEILEEFDLLVKKGIWTEYIYLQEVNIIKDIKDEDLKDVLWNIRSEDGDY
tara:strand:+ start:312 stop:503 length:192 start_codon:yes stop_codon:yes gene_type:complete